MNPVVIDDDSPCEKSDASYSRLVLSYNDWTEIRVRQTIEKYFQYRINIVIVNQLLHGLLVTGKYVQDNHKHTTLIDHLMHVIEQECWNCPFHMIHCNATRTYIQNTFLDHYGSVMFFHTYYSRCKIPAQRALCIILRIILERQLESVFLIRHLQEAANQYTHCFGLVLCQHIKYYHGIDVQNITKGMIDGILRGSINNVRTWIQYTDEYTDEAYMKNDNVTWKKIQIIPYLEVVDIFRKCLIEWSQDTASYSLSYLIKRALQQWMKKSCDQSVSLSNPLFFKFMDKFLRRLDHFRYQSNELQFNEKINILDSGLPSNFKTRETYTK
jgi:hypothetical protein